MVFSPFSVIMCSRWYWNGGLHFGTKGSCLSPSRESYPIPSIYLASFPEQKCYSNVLGPTWLLSLICLEFFWTPLPSQFTPTSKTCRIITTSHGEAIFGHSDWSAMIPRMVWSFKMAHPTTEKTQCSLLTSFKLLLWVYLCFVSVASFFDWGFCFLLPVVADWVVSCLGSVVIYLAVVEFVICKLHPCVSVAELVVCSTCFGLVGPAVAKTHALYEKSVLVLSPCQLQWFLQKLLYPWQSLDSGTLD